LSVSLDSRYILFSQVDEEDYDILLVEQFPWCFGLMAGVSSVAV
jgi:hypothetical protein